MQWGVGTCSETVTVMVKYVTVCIITFTSDLKQMSKRGSQPVLSEDASFMSELSRVPTFHYKTHPGENKLGKSSY